MLDQATKRKIDAARQVLVGKVPDPKAQVEHITTALICKFMDDMDRESEELGGGAKFFAGSYAQCAMKEFKALNGWKRVAPDCIKDYDVLHIVIKSCWKRVAPDCAKDCVPVDRRMK